MTAPVEELDREECVRLLGTKQVGRIAVVDHGTPHVVPVNYAMDGDAIVFRSALGTKLDGASRSTVAFEVDDLDDALRAGWSVVVRGMAQEVTSFDRPDLVERMQNLPIEPWAPGDKPHIVRIAPHTMTGRRLRAASSELGDCGRGYTGEDDEPPGQDPRRRPRPRRTLNAD